MANDKLEKTIKGLECLAGMNEMKSDPCIDCGYQECQTYAICIEKIASDVLSLLKAQEEEIKQLKAMNISTSNNAFACGVIHGGITINQKAKEITNIKHVDVFNG